MQENPHVTHVSLNSSNRMFLSAFLHETCHYENNLKGQAEYEYGVEWGLSHPEYLKSNSYQDIELLKLVRDAVMETDFVQPICLPLKFDKSDVVEDVGDMDVFTSGWGRLWSSCNTNKFGPVKNLKFKLPFKFGMRISSRCATSKTPSSQVTKIIN